MPPHHFAGLASGGPRVDHSDPPGLPGAEGRASGLSQRADGCVRVTRVREERASNEVDVGMRGGMVGARQELGPRDGDLRQPESESPMDPLSRREPIDRRAAPPKE